MQVTLLLDILSTYICYIGLFKWQFFLFSGCISYVHASYLLVHWFCSSAISQSILRHATADSYSSLTFLAWRLAISFCTCLFSAALCASWPASFLLCSRASLYLSWHLVGRVANDPVYPCRSSTAESLKTMQSVMPMTKIHFHLASKGDPGASSTQSATSGNNILSFHNWLKTVFQLDFERCITEADILADIHWAG